MEQKNLIDWIENGKQIGKAIYYTKDGDTYWQSVGIQKWNNNYKVYFFEILKSKMMSDEGEEELIREFKTMEEAKSYVESVSQIPFIELTPLKGQKVFNPSAI